MFPSAGPGEFLASTDRHSARSREVGMSRVERIWKREGLKVPQKQPKRGRLWLNDGSCIRLRPCWPRHVWSYDFVQDRTHDGRSFRILTVIDQFTREWLALPMARRLRDELLNTEIFTTLREAQILTERWRRHYNTKRPHSALGYKPPTPEAILPRPDPSPYATLLPMRRYDEGHAGEPPPCE